MSGGLRSAERVLASLGITEPREIDVEAIAWHLGAKVKYRELDTCEARILGHGNRAIICVDSRKRPERRKFSVAHELGHWTFHRGQCLACRSDEIGNRASRATDPERVADGFAGDLLLPAYLLRPMSQQVQRWSLAQVRGIASEFGTSVTATAYRLIELDLLPGLLVCHSRSGRRWFKRAASVPSRWFPQQDMDHDSQAFDMLFGTAAELEAPSLVDADAWFDQSDASRYQLHEQTYKVPNGEVITLVLPGRKMLD